MSSHTRWRSAAVLAIGGFALAASGCGQTSTPQAEAPHHSLISEERPPHPRHLDVASPAQEAEASAQEAETSAQEAAAEPKSQPRVEPEAKSAPAGSLPPASAGTNGSFVPPPPSKRQVITPRTIEKFEREEAEGRAVLLSGIALAPPSAPEAIKASISAANEIVGRPYIWGGGHDSWYSRGYDCSGSVSYALAAGGFLSAPLTSAQLEAWGAPGHGRWITVYANQGHTYAVIAGLRWDTVGDAQGTGPRWHAALPYPEGFVVRHPPGY
jgi:cell wall-associated NlpC family hydrolase